MGLLQRTILQLKEGEENNIGSISHSSMSIAFGVDQGDSFCELLHGFL